MVQLVIMELRQMTRYTNSSYFALVEGGSNREAIGRDAREREPNGKQSGNGARDREPKTVNTALSTTAQFQRISLTQ